MQKKLEQLTEHFPLKLLHQAADEISERYRAQQKPYLVNRTHYLAYLITRFPATFAAISQVLKQAVGFQPHSMLDLGAGPGTAYLAARDIFPNIKATLLETDTNFIQLGKQLIEDEVNWQQAQLPCDLPVHDLVMMSYSLNEMDDPDTVLRAAWAATAQLFVIIEPGTPDGYQRILRARSLLLASGAHMVAPCPNALPCPMQDGDWCHFPVRVSRSKMHRELKGGTLGYEDEKYSYLIVAKEPYTPPAARIVAPVNIYPGHIKMTVCTQGRIEQQTVTKKDKELYRKCRKHGWGEVPLTGE